MRIVWVILIWLAVIGGLKLYMSQRRQAAPLQTLQFKKAKEHYSLHIAVTFAVEPDPFALQTEEAQSAAALLLRLKGKDILRVTDRLEAGKVIVVEPVPDLVIGRNEFYLEANPPLDQADRAHAVRIRIHRDKEPISEQTLWSTPGVRLARTFSLEIAEAGQADEHEEERHGP